VYEQPTPGRRIGPALIAVLVVLAAAAGTFGYVVTRALIEGQGGGPLAGTSSSGPPSTPVTTSTGPAQTTTPATTAPPTTTPPPVPPGDPTACPQQTADALTAAGLNAELTVQLYIQTHKAGIYDAEVWICKNADDLLIYQGHVLSGPLDRADNGQNTILLADGVKGSVVVEPGGFLATNPSGAGSTTEYHVSRTKLVTVQRPSRATTTYRVIRVYP
jgi:hypothetical protein